MLRRLVAVFLATLLLGAVGCTDSSKGKDSRTANSRTKDETSKGAERGADDGKNQEALTERFDPTTFDRSTTIDNEWSPLKPGTRLEWEGTTVDDEGDTESQRLVFTVTDLTKKIGGVNTVVCWDEDYVDGDLVETEIVFFAQDKDGNVWQLGEYPEEYEDGAFIKASCWIHGIKDSRAGIMMQAKPTSGTPSYSQGWAPSIPWTDRGLVHQTGQKVTVPFGSFEDVLVIDESNKEEPDAHQLKYYARGVGNIRVGWRGDEKLQENLELTKFEQLDAEGLAKAREEALKLEKHAYEISKDVYAHTQPSTAPGSVAATQPPRTDESPAAKDARPGTEELGMTQRELVQSIEKVEGLIAKGMREQGFEYVAADYRTVRRGMTADKSLPGLSEKEFTAKHGFGVSTLYTGKPPQLADGYCPAKVGLGERNIQIYKSLSPADQVAYNRALFGENTDATFAVALETEDFSRCGGCTRQAIEQVFKPEQMKATYYNPKDALINKDPRMKAALRKFAAEIRKAGYDYNHPDEVETDIRRRLYAITGGGTFPVEKLSSEQMDALKKLQDYERRVAVVTFDLHEEIFSPVEEQIEKELFARGVK